MEAAVVVPVFMFAGAALIGFFGLLETQIGVAQELMDEARQLAAVYVSYEEDEGGEDSRAYDESDEYVTLTREYSVRLPVSFFGISEFPVTQSVSCRKWIGEALSESTDENGDSEYVYVTATGSAYHASTSCNYLDLSIRSVSVSSVGSLRNNGGAIYYACSCYSGGSSAYITNYGTNYHGSLTCSGLKRTISTMNKDDAAAAGYHACSKCAG